MLLLALTWLAAGLYAILAGLYFFFYCIQNLLLSFFFSPCKSKDHPIEH